MGEVVETGLLKWCGVDRMVVKRLVIMYNINMDVN